MNELELTGPLPSGRLVIEASAGTGKTYSLSALVVRHVVERGVAASQLLLVTFTRAAAAELRDRTRRALVAASTALEEGAPPPGFEWMTVLLDPDDDVRRERLARVRDAVATFDDATITTIHGFCQQALRQLGLRAGAAVDRELTDSTTALVEEVCRDLVLRELHSDATVLSWKSDIGPLQVLNQLRLAVQVVLANPGAVTVPGGDHLDALHVGRDDRIERLAAWVDLVHEAVRLVDERRTARQEMGYDDLVVGLHRAVHDPASGDAAVATLRSRYALVLVDEFQDTDPLQWDTFARIFDGDLITVGDPKQAIYRFRGADVHAYLRATAGQPTVHLATNHRSDGDLVRATNALVGGVRLGDARIVATPVASAPGAVASALGAGAPLQLRRLPRSASLVNKRGKIAAPLVAQSVLGDLVLVVVDLLESGRLTLDGRTEPVHPGHIAVLVPTNTLADDVVQALGRAAVPAVRARTGSVFETPAAAEWTLLLAALERPSYAPAVRAAGLGVFLRRPPAALDPLHGTAHVAALQQQCARWVDVLARQPFLAWYDHIRAEGDVAARLLGEAGGERQLTDLDHIAELLAVELGGRRTTPASARRALDRLRAEAELEGAEIDAQMRRIDSDTAAVRVTTLHGSKGLEYPIVLLPFSFHTGSSSGPLVFNTADGRRTIDIATRQSWSSDDLTEDARSHLAAVAGRGDALRMLYVGLTRARHRTIVWWAPRDDSAKSALNVVLFDRDESGAPLCTPTERVGPDGVAVPDMPLFLPDDDTAAAQLAVLGTASDGLIGVDECAVLPPPVRWRPRAAATAPPLLAIADPAGRVVADPAWRRWSFTSVLSTREHVWVPAAPVVGGADEPLEAADEPAGAPDGHDMPWADVAAGTAFGTLVHEVLEHVDTASSTLEADLRAEVDRQLRRSHLAVDPAQLVAGLITAIDTPLGPLAGGLRLRDIGIGDRLAELAFDMPLAGGARRATAADLGDVLLRTLPDGDPQLDYARSLAAGRYDVTLGGYLQGSIDAVLRTPGDRYLVVDYKTNRLHRRGAARPLDAYHPDLLPAAMAEHDYPLQSILYSVALHRFLRWRLGAGYRPEEHLGGIAYLFVRGMVGAVASDGSPFGVFAWRPPAAAVVALDGLLAGELP